MSTEDDVELDDVEDDDPELVKKLRQQIRASNKRAKAAEEAAVERDSARRELALMRAGIPDSGTGKLFAKAYDGPLEVDDIRKSAIEYGVLTDEGGPGPEDLAAHGRMEAAANGAAPGDHKPDILRELTEAASHKDSIKGQAAIMEVVKRHNLVLDLKKYGGG